MLSPLPLRPPLFCQICTRLAVCYNYGVFSCNACKMFFRRSIVLGSSYTCQNQNTCFEKISPDSVPPNCQACRFQKCLVMGMTFTPRNVPDFHSMKYEGLTRLIYQLISKDHRRTNILLRQYTSENVNLQEMVEKKGGFKLVVKNPDAKLSTDEWTFLFTFSTADFLMGLDFMQNLDVADKVIMIQNITYKASIAFYAMRSMNENSDKFITPDGNDGIPAVILELFKNSKGYCDQMRSMLISKLIELKITNEELLLLICVLFCNPAVPSISDHAKQSLTAHQRKYSDALLQLCLHTHQQSGPSRFMDLLSLCHVINRNFEVLQSAAILCVLNKPEYEFPRIIDKVLDISGSAEE